MAGSFQLKSAEAVSQRCYVTSAEEDSPDRQKLRHYLICASAIPSVAENVPSVVEPTD